MSLKAEIETWVAALAAYDNNEFDNALKCFETIADTSKILFNLGVINATLGEHMRAVDFYQRAVQLDQYLAVSYFQQGVSNFLMGDFEEALANFNDTLLYLRGNNNIDYEQLGLKFKLYSCEVLFNRGLCYIYLQQKEAGMQDLRFASQEKRVQDHDVIDEAIKEQAEGYTVFSIPVGVVYRPNEAKVKNLKSKDYLGKARLVAEHHQYTNDPRRAALAAMGIDDRPTDKLSYGAKNLVRPDLRSRTTRQQSEPPMHRNIFPPTPPPELDRPESMTTAAKRKSTESAHPTSSTILSGRSAPKPLRLELGAAAFDQSSQREKPRIGTKRSESERPAMRQESYDRLTRRSDDGRREVTRPRYSDVPEVKIIEDPIEANSPQALQQYQEQQRRPTSHQRTRSSGHAIRTKPITISEEEEEATDEISDPSDSPLAFEIIPPKATRQRHRSRAPELRKIRIKVHAEDMRYVMTTPSVGIDELSEQIKTKFGFKGGFKLKIKDDEGDMVTMADQDDLEMAIGICKASAAKDRLEMGKMEMWVQET